MTLTPEKLESFKKNYILTKGKLYTTFFFLKEEDCRKSINKIISNNRSISLNDAKKEHKIHPKEYLMFLNENGLSD